MTPTAQIFPNLPVRISIRPHWALLCGWFVYLVRRVPFCNSHRGAKITILDHPLSATKKTARVGLKKKADCGSLATPQA